MIRKFASGATRNTDKKKLDWEGFISPVAMRRFARYMHQHRVQSDGNLRDSDNWQKGFPRRQIMKSLIRHVWDLWYVWRSSPTAKELMLDLLCAILFNTQAMMLEIIYDRNIEDLDDGS